MIKMILTMMIFTLSLYGQFMRLEDGIVLDSSTQLEWQDDYNGTINSKYFTVKYTSWAKALEYCSSLKLGGHDDWKLPDFEQLSSLIDLSYKKPTINPIFRHKLATKYWSSTTHQEVKNFAGGVFFYTGLQFYYDKLSNNYVRCVREHKE